MNFDSLQIFLEVARKLNFAAVAADRDVNPSSISRSISQLEDELGIRLLQRTTRSMSLTEAGHHFLQRAITLLEELEQTKEELRPSEKGPSGTLRLTASVAFGEIVLMPLMAAFKKQYPNIKLDLIFTDTVVDLISEGIDLAIRLQPSDHADHITTRLMDTRYFLCATPGFSQSIGDLNTPDAMKNVNCITHSLPSYRTDLFFQNTENPAETSRIPIQGDMTVQSALSVKTAILEGLGAGLLADWLVRDDLKKGTLIDLFPHYSVTATNFSTAVWALYPSRHYVPAKVRAMLDFLRRKIGTVT
ncbi:LysR family transcriptional regulator [Sneathiella aquimaris]|uniref:LysR family transcriptional regulator n=1 Tax=Sneathiella aquimaris TaxID=2599305 RepID=UPI00146A7584|nr:LysR family transcriptional regulator [Sneathiella aquimaris]